MRSLIDRQMQAETLYQAALSQESIDMANQAVAAAGSPKSSPPCQLNKMRELQTQLDIKDIGPMVEAEYQRRQQQQAAIESAVAPYAQAALDLLGGYSAKQHGETAPRESVDYAAAMSGGPVNAVADGWARTGQRGCVIQEHGSGNDGTVLTEGPAVAGIRNLHLWSVDSPAVADSGPTNCATTQECLQQMLPSAMQILRSYLDIDSARAEAQKLCNQ
jgi:hypothetical protein